MADPQLVNLIRIQLRNGASKEGMRSALHIGGYTDVQIDEAFTELGALAQAPGLAIASPSGSSPPSFGGTATGVPPSRGRPGSGRALVISGVLLLAVLIGGGIAYAYYKNLGPFARPPYTQSNLVSGLLAASSHITSSTYKASASLAIGPRDPGATPFTIQATGQDTLKTAYKDDSERMSSITEILLQLKLAQLRSYGRYPASLQSIRPGMDAVRYQTVSINDPKTGAAYEYHTVQAGEDFKLSVTFETPDAIAIVRRMSGFAHSSQKVPVITGQTVTFTKDTGVFLTMSPTPPKPFIETLGDVVRFLPPTMSANLAATAASDWTNTTGGFTFNLDANGDFGDLTYKVNVDLLKKGSDYYFRINNLPDLFGGTISSVKGKWIVISASATSTASSSDLLGVIASKLPEEEQTYKKNRAATADLIRTIAAIADQEGLIRIEGTPYAEAVNGESLYHYDLSISKDAIVPFYQRALDAASSTAATTGSGFFVDSGTLRYLESDEFNQVFDYMQSNTKITLWTDGAGNPRIIKYTMRLVPPDTAVQLKNKQANLALELDISNINQPVSAMPPPDATPLQDVIKQASANEKYTSPF